MSQPPDCFRQKRREGPSSASTAPAAVGQNDGFRPAGSVLICIKRFHGAGDMVLPVFGRNIMPVHDALIIGGIVFAFVLFAAVLAWGDHQTRSMTK
jgi:hypothetical protein